MSEAKDPSAGKDLQDLQGLSGSAVHSFLRRAARPTNPRNKSKRVDPSAYPSLAAFAPQRLWQWLTLYFRYRFGRRHKFLSYISSTSSGVYQLQGDGDEIRLAVAGDWGTGTDEAAMVAKQIHAFKAHYTIHLGDVYYVGDPGEVAETFFGKKNQKNGFTPTTWPLGENGSFSLLGNHEMYARGIGYFDQILPALGPFLDGKSQGQLASFFCLENEFWRIIAVDTGYNSVGLPLIEYLLKPDCSLPETVLEWLRKTIRPSPNDPRGIILLTHHQYFSRFGDWCIRPAQQLTEFFERPVLWFWGHEHRLAVYGQFSPSGGIKAFGRCIGHGGMPVELPPGDVKHPECPVSFVDERIYENDENLKIGLNGFARMTIKSKHLNVDYVDLHGVVIYSEAWHVEDGRLMQSPDITV